jgi:uncharacterized OB-fold protein
MTMNELPVPERTTLTEPYWKALEEGRLQFQKCNQCGHAWLPPRAECPECLREDWAWQSASGRAKLVSWVVFHLAYHDYFKDRVPYNVAVVELEEGPRMISNIVGGRELRIDQPLKLLIEKENGVAIARFGGL